MYTSVNNDLIYYDFNPIIKVGVIGNDNYYLVEVKEYKPNHHSPLLIQSYPIGRSLNTKEFTCDIQFYFDFEISVYKFLDDYGIKKIFTHRFDDTAKLVNFNLETQNEKEAIIWYQQILEYQKKHQCQIFVQSEFKNITDKNNSLFNKDLNFYKTYNIGRFPKSSKDFKTLDPRTEGYIQFGWWKKFWSYQNPRNWNELSTEQIAKDILNL